MSSLFARYKAASLRTVKPAMGDDIQVRPLSKMYFLSMGDIPSVLFSEPRMSILNGGDKGQQVAIVGEHLSFFTKLLHYALTQWVVMSVFKMVLNEPEQSGEEEIPLVLRPTRTSPPF